MNAEMLRQTLIELRSKLGLTQAVVAEMAGLSQTAYSAFERGETEGPHATTMLKLEGIVQRLSKARAEGGSMALMAPSKKCPECGEMTVGPECGAAYCLFCGYQFGRRCTQCGVVCRVLAQYCDACGEPFERRPVSEGIEQAAVRESRVEINPDDIA